LLLRKAKPVPARPPEQGSLERVLISLCREGEAGIRTEVRVGAELHGQAVVPAMPKALAEAHSRRSRTPHARHRAAFTTKAGLRLSMPGWWMI
jgi:hypothetical protein